ncbi:MAG TPA: hypothetical protein DD417_08165 [Elusimicrobia bacterium]|nr:hypothetical protein [Elusimicrobiota bacterium]
MPIELKRVLIADDDPALVELMTEGLAKLPIGVEQAFDGKEALEKVRSGAFDLVLLDIMMPMIDGYHIASEITSTMGEQAPKILYITSRDTKREGHLAGMTGAIGMLQKPFEMKEFREAVCGALGLPSPQV